MKEKKRRGHGLLATVVAAIAGTAGTIGVATPGLNVVGGVAIALGTGAVLGATVPYAFYRGVCRLWERTPPASRTAQPPPETREAPAPAAPEPDRSLPLSVDFILTGETREKDQFARLEGHDHQALFNATVEQLAAWDRPDIRARGLGFDFEYRSGGWVDCHPTAAANGSIRIHGLTGTRVAITRQRDAVRWSDRVVPGSGSETGPTAPRGRASTRMGNNEVLWELKRRRLNEALTDTAIGRPPGPTWQRGPGL